MKRIAIKDLKGFQNCEFTFGTPEGKLAGWTVITGDNGSGKTSLLKSMALALVGPDLARALQPSLRGWVRSGRHIANVAVEILPHEVDKYTAGRRYERAFWSELDLVGNGGPEVSLKGSNRRLGGKKGPINGPWSDSTEGWFAAGYGPFRRLYGASVGAHKVMLGPRRVACFATMFMEDATLEECQVWLQDLNYKKIEGRPAETKVLGETLDLLNDDFLRHGMRVDKVDSDGLWLRGSGGTLLPLADMSDGYRAALAMMIDIVRHLVTVHGHVGTQRNVEGHVVVPHPGVVLIDEVDAHLHPEWQRQIGFWLKGRFPNIQFIVTSHSPLVCQAADQRGIYHLPATSSGEEPFQLSEIDYWKVVRGRPDEILLSRAFGLTQTRSDAAVEKRRDYARLKVKARAVRLSPEEDKQVDWLKEKYIGSDPLED